MTKINEIYKCEMCGNIVEVLHTGGGDLSCCGQIMDLKKENTEEAATEKHIPVIKDDDKVNGKAREGGLGQKGKRITVGEVEHPMEAEHYIEWIEVLFPDGKVIRRNLKPGEEPSIYCSKDHSGDIIRAYCNVHGLWVKK